MAMSSANRDDLRRLVGPIPEIPAPNGDHPAGRISGDDSGRIGHMIAGDPDRQLVFLVYGGPVAWLGMSVAEAEKMAADLRTAAAECRAEADATYRGWFRGLLASVRRAGAGGSE